MPPKSLKVSLGSKKALLFVLRLRFLAAASAS